jgi:hypothetical protein
VRPRHMRGIVAQRGSVNNGFGVGTASPTPAPPQRHANCAHDANRHRDERLRQADNAVDETLRERRSEVVHRYVIQIGPKFSASGTSNSSTRMSPAFESFIPVSLREPIQSSGSGLRRIVGQQRIGHTSTSTSQRDESNVVKRPGHRGGRFLAVRTALPARNVAPEKRDGLYGTSQ